MRKFLVLCLVAFVGAAPQYNYNLPSASHSSGIISGVGHNHDGGFIGSSNGFGSHHGSSSGSIGYQAPIITKNFFIHSAPEEQPDVGQHKVVTVGAPRRSYNIVFIKGPSQSTRTSAGHITIQQAPQEDKTVIYVLAQKSEVGEIQTDVQASQVQSSKPEVFFIKYKTPEEAEHAQHQIQAQYDALGGTSQVSDEGVAPLSSAIGTVGNGGNGGNGGVAVIGGNGGIGNGHSHIGSESGSHGVGIASNYLPPN